MTSQNENSGPTRIITIDGPAASGKSTVGRIVAARLGFQFLDTGAIYRTATLAAMNAGIDLQAERVDFQAIIDAVDNCKLEMNWQEDAPVIVRLDNKDVTQKIRTEWVTENVRYVADLREVRELASKLQRQIAEPGNFVSDGRDQGTEVFPNAFLKIYLWAAPDKRARRRFEEIKGTSEEISLEELERKMRNRDRLDMSREVGALKKAIDAVEIDSSDLTIQEVSNKIVELAEERLKNLS